MRKVFEMLPENYKNKDLHNQVSFLVGMVPTLFTIQNDYKTAYELLSELFYKNDEERADILDAAFIKYRETYN